MARRESWKFLATDGRLAFARRDAAWALFLLGLYTFLFVAIEFAPRLSLLLVPLSAATVWLLLLGPRPAFKHSLGLTTLAPSPPPEGTYPVWVCYLSHLDEVGRDEALAAFVDGWLVVSGLRASFGLRPDDAYVTVIGNDCVLDFKHGQRVEILPLDALKVEGSSRTALRRRFEAEARRWIVESAFVSGEAVLPPFVDCRYPMRQSDGRVALGLAASFLGGILLLASIGSPLLGPLGASGFGGGIGLVGCGIAQGRRYLQYVQSLPPRLRKALPQVEFVL